MLVRSIHPECKENSRGLSGSGRIRRNFPERNFVGNEPESGRSPLRAARVQG